MRLRHDRCVARGGVARDRQHYHPPYHHHLLSLPSIITIITQFQLHASIITIITQFHPIITQFHPPFTSIITIITH